MGNVMPNTHNPVYNLNITVSINFVYKPMACPKKNSTKMFFKSKETIWKFLKGGKGK